MARFYYFMRTYSTFVVFIGSVWYMIRSLLVFFLLLLISTLAVSQDYENPEYRALMVKMEEGVTLMNQGDYNSADFYFQKVLEDIEVVPAELCFYFGKNSYHLEKYKQSIDWLNKYIELKGTRGQFFDQAKEYLALAETDFLAQQRKPSKPSIMKSKAQPQQIDCESVPFVLCPVCQGSGVLIERGSLGNAVYRTCPYSDEQGRMPCSNYEKYLRGTPVPLAAEE